MSVPLSNKNEKRLIDIGLGQERIRKYYQFYKKDSANHARKEDRRYKHLVDSTYKAEKQQARINKRLAKKGTVAPLKETGQLTKIDSEIQKWSGIMNDTTLTDSARLVARDKVKDLALEKASAYPGFQNLAEQYQLNGDSASWESIVQQVPGLDTLKSLFDSDPRALFQHAEKKGMDMLSQHEKIKSLNGNFSEMDKLKSLPTQEIDKYKNLTDKERLKKEADEKALAEAEKYFEDNADKIKGYQGRMSKLLSKYREFSNAENLEGATKATSMKGKTFVEHLVIGGNFNIVSTDPVSIDFSPVIGWKFTTRFSVGAGMNYRRTFGDSIKSSWYISPRNTSIRGFVNYDLIKGFSGYAEWEHSAVTKKGNDQSKPYWRDNYYIGIGKKFLMHSKIYFTTTLLYNLNGEEQNPLHKNRFQLRFGFQLSELATRKKQVYYNPNR